MATYMTGELIYLAVPFTHPDKAVVEDRVRRVNIVAAKLMAQGKYVFSPISHTYPISLAGDLPGNWEFWEGFDTVMISRSSCLYVLMLEGWEESKGVNEEIKLAKAYDLPVVFIDENLVVDRIIVCDHLPAANASNLWHDDGY
jgi:hypothetical protein